MPTTTEETPDVRQAALLALLKAGLAHGQGEEDGLHADGHGDLAGLAEWINDPANLKTAFAQQPEQFDEHEWEESKHKRAKDGRFGSGGGGSKKEKKPAEWSGEVGDDTASRRKKTDAVPVWGDITGNEGPAVKDAKKQAESRGLKLEPAERADIQPGTEATWDDIIGPGSGTFGVLKRSEERQKAARESFGKKCADWLGATKDAILNTTHGVGKAVYDRLPRAGQIAAIGLQKLAGGLGHVGKETAKGLYGAYAWLEHNILDKPRQWFQRLAVQSAIERGLGEEHAEKVGAIVTANDTLHAWTANIPLAHEALHTLAHIDGWTGFGLAKIGFFCPTVSVLYCFQAGIRNPWAMCKAAWSVLRGTDRKSQQSKGQHHAEEGVLGGKELMGDLQERMHDAGENADWFLALYSAAFDMTHDARRAIDMAQDAIGEGWGNGALDDNDQDVLDWYSEYTAPGTATNHAEWKEDEHPRAEGGKFGSGSGGQATADRVRDVSKQLTSAMKARRDGGGSRDDARAAKKMRDDLASEIWHSPAGEAAHYALIAGEFEQNVLDEWDDLWGGEPPKEVETLAEHLETLRDHTEVEANPEDVFYDSEAVEKAAGAVADLLKREGYVEDEHAEAFLGKIKSIADRAGELAEIGKHLRTLKIRECTGIARPKKGGVEKHAEEFAERWDAGKHRVKVESSNVDWIQYDPDEEILRLGFNNGERYAYSHVSTAEAAGLLAASSKGTWIWDNIRVRGKGNSRKTRKTFGKMDSSHPDYFGEDFADDLPADDFDDFDEDWQEDKHPRGEGGRFGAGGGGTKPAESRVRGEVPAPIKRNLGLIARTLRRAVEKGNRGPKDICIAAAAVIKQTYPEAEIWSGTVSGEPHTIVKLAGKFIDVSADQFGSGFPKVAVFDPEDMEDGGDHDYYGDMKRDHHEEKRLEGHKGWANGDKVKKLFDGAIKKRGARLKDREEATDFDEGHEWEESKHKRGEGGKFTSGAGKALAGHREKVAGIRRAHQEGKDAVRATHREERTKIAATHKEKNNAIVAKVREKIAAEKAKGKKKVAGLKAKQNKLREKVAGLKQETEANHATIKAGQDAVQHLANHPELNAYAATFSTSETGASLLDPEKNTCADLLDILTEAEQERKVSLIAPDVRAKLKAGAKAEDRNEKIESELSDHESDIEDLGNDIDEVNESTSEKVAAHKEEGNEALDALVEKTDDLHERAKEKAEKAHGKNHEKHQAILEQAKDEHTDRVSTAWGASDDAQRELMWDGLGNNGQAEHPGGKEYVGAVDSLRKALRGAFSGNAGTLVSITPKEMAGLAQKAIEAAEAYHAQNKDNPQAEEDGFLDEAREVVDNAKALVRSCRKVHRLGGRDIAKI